jgi:hypothetical protein
LIALFAGLLLLVIMRRKHTPRPVELLLWAGLVWVCILGVSGVHDEQARDLTVATFWGTYQLLGSLIAVAQQGAWQWMVDNRFILADWAVLLVGADLLALAILRSRREAAGWQPQIRLRDWMELPRFAAQPVAPVTVSGVDEINQRFNLWAPIAATAALTWTTLFLIWSGEVAMPTIGRRMRKAALTADGARRQVAKTDWHRVIRKAGSEPRRLTEQVVDIADVSKAAADMRTRAATWLTDAGAHSDESWLGGFGMLPPNAEQGGTDGDGTEPNRRDQLAS